MENVYKYSDHKASLKLLQCGAKFNSNEHSTALKKLEDVYATSLTNAIIPIEVCVPVKGKFHGAANSSDENIVGRGCSDKN